MSLISAKPTLQSQIKQIMYNGAYWAFKEMCTSGSDVSANIKSQLDSEMEKTATKFAKTFSEKVYSDLGNAIYDFTKSIAIMMTPSGTLIAPTMGGPVTGSALNKDFIVT